MDSGHRQRPAYTDQTLARAMRDGIDPTGRAFEPAMPRFDLDDHHMAALIAYLMTLQAEPSEGVTVDEIQFATVVAGAVVQVYRDGRIEAVADEGGHVGRSMRPAAVGRTCALGESRSVCGGSGSRRPTRTRNRGSGPLREITDP